MNPYEKLNDWENDVEMRTMEENTKNRWKQLNSPNYNAQKTGGGWSDMVFNSERTDDMLPKKQMMSFR